MPLPRGKTPVFSLSVRPGSSPASMRTVMISSNQDIALLNLKTFRDEAVVRHYVRSTGLQGAEIGILSRIQSTFRHKRILDIGVGGGRTTLALLNISKDYIGIDISPEMITECRRCYPSIAFEVCDARELSRFPNESFDLVFFSYNGIDSIGHSDRLRALREIYRVLARGGAFAFSSHNRRGLIRRPMRSASAFITRKPNESTAPCWRFAGNGWGRTTPTPPPATTRSRAT